MSDEIKQIDEKIEVIDTQEKRASSAHASFAHESFDDDKPEHTVIDLQEGTKRHLSTRVIVMVALGGSIGTGLYLNMGANIAEAGPGGAFIAYCAVGLLVYCLMTCLSEMSAYIPVSGAFNHYASRFFEPALGFALGWNYWVGGVTAATELAAAATIIDFWKPVMPDAAWSTIFMVIILALNLFSVRIYGESEYYLSLVKVLMVIVFCVICIIYTSGGIGPQGPIGFKYWYEPGAFTSGVGFVGCLLSAGFSYQGTEIVGNAAGEAAEPAKAIPRAINLTFYRILVFYVLTILLVGMCLPYDNTEMTDDGNPSASPFTLVLKYAGIGAGVDVVNAIILVSVLSACNSSIYVSSRALLGLARDGNAPAIFNKTNRFGAPYMAVLASSIFGFICCFVSIYSAEVAFTWFMRITSISGFNNWMWTCLIQIRFRLAYIKQGRDLNELPYKSPWFPIPAIFAALFSLVIIVGQGYTAFTPSFSAIKFVSKYIGVLPFIVIYIVHKLLVKQRWVPMEEIDFETGRVTKQELERVRAEVAAQPWYRRYLYILA